MKKMENFLRRALSMVLSICMLFGNMGTGFASVVSEGTGPLSDYIDYSGQSIATTLDMTYIGTSDYVYNGSGFTTLDDYHAWYWVDVSVSQYVQSIAVVMESSVAPSGQANVSLYRGNSADSIDMNTLLGTQWDNYTVTATTSGTQTVLRASNTGMWGMGHNMPTGYYRFLVGIPIPDDKVVDMLNNGSTIVNTAGGVAVNDVSGTNTGVKSHTVSFTPVVTKKASYLTSGPDKYIRWEVHYTNGIKLHNTVYTDTTNYGEFVENWKEQIGGENAIQAYEGEYLISGGQTVSNDKKTITFNVTGVNEESGYTDLRYKYSTDMKLVYFTKITKHMQDSGINETSILSTYSLTPNGIAGTTINGKASMYGPAKDVVVKLQRVENGGEPVAVHNQDGNRAIRVVMGNAAQDTFDAVYLPNSTGTTGEYKTTVNYTAENPVVYVTMEQQSINADCAIGHGESVYINANNNNQKTEAIDLFVAEVQDDGATAVVTLTNYVNTVPVNVAFVRNTNGTEATAEFTGYNPTNLYAVLMDDEGNAVSTVVKLEGTRSGNVLNYSGVLSSAGSAQGHVALLTLKPNQSFDANNDPNFYADKFNVHDGLTEETATIDVNMDTDNAISVYETFDVNVVDDAATGGKLIKLVNAVDSVPVTVKIESYDETTKQYSAETPYYQDPGMYLAVFDAEGNAISDVVKPSNDGNGIFTADLVVPAGAEGEVNLLMLNEQKQFSPTYNEETYERYYEGKTKNTTVYIECDGPNQYSQNSASMDEFFSITVTENQDGSVLVHLVNDRASALQGLVEAYNGGKLEINEESGSFADYDGGKYFNELSPIGIAGSFHLVAFDTANLDAHTNGNVLANVLHARNNFGTNGYPFELSYVVDYQTVHTTSASDENHILALGAGNKLSVTENGAYITVGDTSTRISKPKNVIIDRDADKPFIDINAVEQEVRALSATLASNNENVGISEDFSGNFKRLKLTSTSGAGYYNMDADTLMRLGTDLRLDFTDQNKGSIVINVDCSGKSYINMPERALVNINGTDQGTAEVTTFENGKVIWNFVNLAEGTVIDAHQMTGMIIAPGATVNLKANVNGTVIADTINVKAESHRTDFTGTVTPASGAFSAVKQVNGRTPTGSEKFWFVLEELNSDNTTWTEVQRVQNDGSKIEFANITYNEAGLHTYRIRELDLDVADGYTISTETYYMQVDVYANSVLGNTALGKKYTFWKENQSLPSNEHFIFNNGKDTVDLVVVKKDSKDDSKLLEGAVFEVWKDGALITTVTTNNLGRASLSHLANGTYTLKEVQAPTGYELPEINEWTFTKNEDVYTLNGTYENALIEGEELTVENDHIATVTVSGSKTWNDNNNLHNNRPESITIVLLAGDEVYQTKTVTANDGWRWSFTELPALDANGEEIVYTIQEITVPGYTSQVSGYNIINNEEFTSVSGEKIWEGDNEVVALTRPGSVNINVWEGSTKVAGTQATASGNWQWSVSGLPAYRNGQPIVYTVTEDEVPGYTATVSGTNITNTLITTKEEGEKVWEDFNNKYSLRPNAITVTLVKSVNVNGSAVVSDVETQTVTAPDWKWSFIDLPTKELVNGVFCDVTYSVRETPVNGYTTAADGENLVNTLKTIDINGTKEWVDGNNAYSTRPEKITINLLQNESEIDEFEATSADNWSWKFENLPEFDSEGNAYRYTVSEDVVNGYQSSYDQANYKVTNTLYTKDLNGVKEWADQKDLYELRPESVVIKIMNGSTEVTSVTAYASSGWTWEVKGLPKFDKATGNEIIYTVSEVPANGYTAVVTGIELKNVLETVDLEGDKEWIGDAGYEQYTRPEQITVTATSSDAEGQFSKTVTTTADDDWYWIIEDLPKFYADGTEVVYVVTEAPVAGYENTGIEQNEDGLYIIENTVETTEVTVNKVWEDRNNEQNTRGEYQVQLMLGEDKIGAAVTLSATQTSHTWTGLPKYGKDGAELQYSVDEVSMPEGYVKSVTGSGTSYTVTNTYVFASSAVMEAQKVLEGPTTLQAGQFTFLLKDAEGNTLQEKTNDATGKVTFDAIEYKAAGTHNYTISEVKGTVGGYTYDETVYNVTVTVTQNQSDMQLNAVVTYTDLTAGTTVPTFVNTYEVEPTSISIPVEKILSGTEGKTKVPDIEGEFTFELTGSTGAPLPAGSVDGKATITNDGTADGFGPIEFTAAGEYTYTVTESGYVPGVVNDATASKSVTVKVTDDGEGKLHAAFAETSAEEIIFTNTYTTVDLSGEKKWEGDDLYADVIRPASITVVIKNGTATVETLTVEPDADGKWMWSVTELPAKDEQGNDIFYTVEEITVPGYDAAVITGSMAEGFVITNTMKATEVTVNKVWVDEGDKDGKRPDDITVQLKADNANFGEPVTLNDDNTWTYKWEKLPAFTKTGAAVTYTVDEVSVPAGYVKTTTSSGTSFTITNTYVFASSAVMEAEKVLEGPTTLQAEQFTFELKDAEGNVLQTVKNDANGKVTFAAIEYKTAGEYTYTISEVKGSVGGYTYDETVYNVTVKVTQDPADKQLSTEVIYTNLTAGTTVPTFVNTYEVEPDSLEIPVIKHYVVADELKATAPDITNDFTFTLEAVTAGAPMPADAVDGKATITNSVNEAEVYFGEIEFTAVGEYEYKITESGTVAGVDNDATAERKVKIVVTDDGVGNLHAAFAADSVSVVEYTNTYDVEDGKATIPVEKTLKVPTGLNGPKTDVVDAYSFTIANVDGAPMPAGSNVIRLPLKGGSGSFGEITFTEPGEYKYTITESCSLDYIENDPELVRNVTVIVTDDGEGQLVTDVQVGDEKADKASYTNTYTATPDTITIPVVKKYVVEEGLNAPDITGQFTFTLTASEGAPLPADRVMSITNDGSATGFDTITFDKVGTYTYTIEETGKVTGVQNDAESTKTVTVTVTDNGEGVLTATSTLAEGEKITFTNRYEVGKTTAQIPVEKILKMSSDLTGPAINEAFTFTLAAKGDEPMPADGKTIIKNPAVNGGTAYFGEIEFTKPGDYYYTVTETGTVAGVTNDTATKDVTIKVSDDGQGNLSAAVVGNGGSKVTFTNEYKVEPTKAAIPVEKKLVGAQAGLTLPDIAKQFTFTLTAVDGAPLPTTTSITNDGAAMSFGEITFAKAGTYTYTVAESGKVAGVTNDGVKEVTITVVDNKNGTLTATVACGDSSTVVFTNVYDVEKTSIQIPVEKTLSVPEGLTGPEADVTFTFTLAAKDDANMPAAGGEVITISLKSGVKEASFGAIEYTAPGTYKYTVTESGSAAGVTNDTAEKEVSVIVTDDGTGKLSAVVSFGADEAQKVSYTNTYGANPDYVSIPVVKVLTSEPAGLALPNINEKYQFKITGSTGAPMPATTEYTYTGSEMTFGPIEFTAVGEYTYTLSEVNLTSVPGVTNDTELKQVKVTVTDDGKGNLNAVSSLAADANITFTNVYRVGNVDVSIPAEKIFTVKDGQTGLDVTGLFTFTLTAVTPDAPMPAAGEEVKQNPDKDGGIVTFGKIEYTKPGVYIYEVTESVTDDADNKLPGVTNDALMTKTVTVTVTDHSDGTMSLTCTSTTDSPVSFTNSYEAGPVEATIPVEKLLNAADGLNAPDITNAFTFTLTADEAGNPMPTVKSCTNPDADGGDMSFGPISFDKVGTFNYTITETGEVDGVSTDSAKKVSITVVDNGDGTLSATVTPESGSKVTFTNEYTVEPTTAQIPVKKTVSIPEGQTGPGNVDGKFTFTLEAVTEGAPMPAVTEITNSGETFSFAAITFPAPGTFQYKVTESGEVAGITNDLTATKTVTIEVTDNGDGSLTAVVAGNDGEYAHFTNSYNAKPVPYSIPVEKTLSVAEGLTAPDIVGAYTFTITGSEPLPETRSFTNAEGVDMTFGPVQFTKEGTYTYTITESGKVAGVQNDSAKTVTIKVADDGKGNLYISESTLAEDEAVVFTNTYTVGNAEISFSIEKALEVADNLKGTDITGKFTFTLAAVGTAPMPEETQKTNPAKDGGTVTFGPIKYSEPGTFTYSVTESGEVDGVENDATTVKNVVVTVVDNGNGTMTATASTETTPVVFTNTYLVDDVPVTVPVEKSLSYADGLTPPDIDGEFTFAISSADADAPMPVVKTLTYTEDADGKPVAMSFGPISFSHEGEWTYTITESGKVAGITNDSAKTFTVTVTDNGDGTLTAKTSLNGESIKFVNEYDVEDTTVSFPVEKILSIPEGLTGPEDITGLFTFTLTRHEDTPEAPLPVECVKTNGGKAGGTATFGEITYTEPGTYKYWVTESGKVDGITNDATASKLVTVTVVDNSNGTMTATADYTHRAPLTFTNDYDVEDTTVSFPVEKILKVPTGLTAGSIKNAYTFTLTAEEGTPMPQVTEYTNPEADGGTVTFGDITYTEPGTYTYTVTESGEVAGVTNDATASKTVTVTVVDNGNGTMTATATSTEAKPLTFTNRYDTDDCIAEIPVEKVLEIVGGDDPDSIEGKFTFTLEAVTEGAPMPETTVLQNPDEDGGMMIFGDITFIAPGTFEYTVTETVTENADVSGITNDEEATKSVTITVTDNGAGKLIAEVSVSEDEPLTFTNQYDVEDTTASIPVEKILNVPTGLTAGDISGAFTFTLEAVTPGAPMPETDSLTNPDADGGEMSFGEITFSAPGTYEYTVTESGAFGGVTNDEKATKEVTITVVDNGDGTMTATVDTETGDVLTFENDYDVADTTVSFPIEKKVEAAEGLTAPDITGLFSFTLSAGEGVPMPDTIRYTNPDADGGVVTFGEITYTEPGEYVYTVSEAVADGKTAGGFSLAGDLTVTVTVVDNGNGTMTATATSTEDNTLAFTNRYSVGDATASIPVEKKLEILGGVGPDSIEGKFTFTLEAVTPGAPMPEVTEYTNPDADGGLVTFGDMTYTKPGTYNYKITETGSDDGITNDVYNVRYVSVVVTDNGDGTLTAECNYTDESPVTFINTYDVEDGKVSFPVEKILVVPEGLTAADITGKFTFTLTAEEGTPMPEVTSYQNPDADGGVVTFGEILYTEVGTYEYTITESGSADGVSNDAEASKTVTVTVVDDGKGQLVATASVSEDEPLTFTNEYNVGETKISIPAKKVLNAAEGLTPASIAEKFTFTLTAVTAGAPMPAETVLKNPDANGGVVTFGEISYTEPGIFVYEVTESGSADGVTNDPVATRQVTVTVVDNGNGTLTATSTATASAPVVFTNDYTVKETTVSFPVEKILEVPAGMNGTDITGAFTFTLTAEEGTPVPTETEFTNPDADGGVVTFGEITYTEPGTYVYTITETGRVDGVVNDEEAAKTVTVTVVDNGNGTMTATATSTEQQPLTFTNSYEVEPTTVSFPVEKILQVADELTAPDITGEFTFTLTAEEGTPMPEVTEYTNPDADGGVVTFGEIGYTEPGTYYYTITETGKVDGITNDTTAAKTVTVTVVDNGNGTLTATADSTTEQPLTFTNTYTVKDVTASIPVRKILTVPEGLTAGDITGAFTFTLAASTETPDAPMPATTEYTNPAKNGGDVVFGTITYTVPGTYKYTVTESGSFDGVTNDQTATKEVTVTVVDNSDGTMTATVSATESAPVTFTNSYSVEPTKASFPVKKTLTVPEGLSAASIAGKFTFTLTAEEGTPMPKVTSYQNPDADGGVVTFGDIEYTMPGTYTYTVTETGKVDGITNDTKPAKTVTVTVVDNGNGTLTATASSTEEQPLTFVNDYGTEDCKVSFPVKKVLAVDEILDPASIAGKFTFTLEAVTANAPMPVETSFQNPDADGGVVTFGQITYSMPGTYEYTVTESVTEGADVSGITNDAQLTKTVTVKVEDNGLGKLVATVSSTDDEPLTFTNTYTVEPTEISFPVEKILVVPEGLTAADITGKFTFTLTAAEGTPVPTVTSYQNPDADGGVVTFGDIEYTEPGTYVYTITESGSADGVTNDATAAKTVTVTVVDNGNGTLTATATATEDEPLTFTNSYSVKPTTISFPAKKVLDVADGLTAPDITGEYTFTLTADEGVPMPAVTSYTNPAKDGGVVTFGDIGYTEPGTYVYTITETGKVDGITNDAELKTVTVTVVDNGDGTLTATADSTADKPATFTNTYTVEPTGISFPVEKILTVPEGLTPGSIAGLFTFTLTAEEGVPMPTVTSYQNPDEDGGVVTFGNIEYTEPGTYVYTITETGSADGVTNDEEASKTVTVTVVDNSDGTMTATATSTEESPLTFTNEYSVEPTTVSFPVEKILVVPEGLKANSIEGKFTFTLAAVDGAPLPAQIAYTTPEADGGVVTFGEIEYTMPGTYEYTVTETGEVDGITNDAEATKTVTVTVVDNGDGTLTATASSTVESTLTFTNSYSVEPTTASFPAKKTLAADEGLSPASIAGKFTFTLTAAEGVPMPEVTEYTNPADNGGVVTFGDIEYTMPGTYTYTITESGKVAGITNDLEAEKTVTVTVVDNGDGTLTATSTSTEDEPLNFTNVYEVQPRPASFPVKKLLDKEESLTPNSIEGLFTFTLTADEGVPMPEVTALVNPDFDGGMVTFGEILFTEPGKYVYTITETGSADGVTNDAEASKTVVFDVVDNGDGTMTATASSAEPDSVLAFTNTYEVEPVTISFPVEKILEVDEGDTAPDITGKFTFELAAVDGAPLPDTIRYTNPAADGGVVTFGEITYTLPGTYEYTVTETGYVVGVINDATTTKTVTVTVVDNGNGTMTATATSTADAPLTFTNSNEVVDINVTKDWQDDNNRDGKRPASIQVQLMADGENVGDPVTLDESNNWSHIFPELPRYSTATVDSEIAYTVVEIVDEATAAEYDIVINYSWDLEGNGDVTIVNTHVPETVEISGSKSWDDIGDKYLKRPDSVTIRLYEDGVEVASKVVTEADNWSWTFSDLPKYKIGAQGQLITYTISEDVVTGYITTIDEYNVLNTLNLVEFIKIDEQTGKPLPGAKFALYEGGAATAGTTTPVMTWTSDGTPKILAGLKVGQTYTIVETEAPSGYACMTPFVFTVELTDTPSTYRSFTAGNCHIYRFRKLDTETNGLVFGARLAVLQGDQIIDSWWTNSDNNGWHEIADDRLIPGVTYTLAELQVAWGYLYAEPIYFVIDENDGMLIVNGSKTNKAEIVMYDAPAPEVTPTPEPTETSFTVTKRWEDKEDILGLRPSSITVHLYRKLKTAAEYPTVPYMTVNMFDNGKDVWTFTFDGLPRRDADGVLYEYMIREELVEGYVVSYLNNGKTIVNSIPEEDYPPTPTPTLPYATPTPAPTGRAPAGVQFIDGEWFYIDEYGIPLGGVPLTGDDTNFVLWGMAIGLPLLVAALAAVEIRRRKKLLAAAGDEDEAQDEE